MSTQPTLASLTSSTIGKCLDGIQQVWTASFTAPPYREDPDQFQWLQSTLQSDGAITVVATADGAVVGFASGKPYAPPADPSEWSQELARSVGPAVADEWLYGQFAVDAIAVSPSWRGQHLGGRLHDVLLGMVTQPRAWLITYEFDCPARRLYQARRWRKLGTGRLGSHGASRDVLGRSATGARSGNS